MNLLKDSELKFWKVLESVKRFISSSILIFCLFILLVIITFGNFNSEILKYRNKIIISIGFGIIFCAFSELVCENYFKNHKSLIIISNLLISAIPYLLLEIYNFNEYLLLGLVGISISFFIMIFYFADKNNISKVFSYILKNILFNFFVCTIVFIGGSLCIWAFTTLIHNFQNVYKAYLITAEFSGILLFLHLYLAALPKENHQLNIPKIFKTLIFKTMLPIYVLLLLILHIYIFKILIIRIFPSGKINWFVSISSFLYIFFMFTLNQYKNENKLIKLFLDYSGYILIPTILMQFLAIYIRISNYGLTSLRYISIVLNIFVLIFVLLSLFRQEKILKNNLIILSAFILLLSVTPLNIFDVPILEQSYRLKNLMLKNQMLNGNEVIKNNNINVEEKRKIISAYNFIKNNITENSRIKLKFLPNVNNSPKNIFGFDEL
jgi:hypothetical protein